MSLLRVAPLALLAALILPAAAFGSDVAEIAAPPFVVRAPAPLRFQAERIAGLVPDLAARVAAEMGLPAPGGGEIVVLGGTPKHGDPLFDAALGMPPWAAGLTIPSASAIVIRLDRIGTYGQREITTVLAHELAHLTVAAALPRRGRELPVWFGEGIASSVAGEWGWRDPLIVWFSSLPASQHPFADLDTAYERGEPSRAVAYSGGFAAMTFLRRAYGQDFPARLLSDVRGGSSFEAAFARSAGVAVDQAERAWRDDLRRPRRWIVWIGSVLTLWIVITVLILIAYAVKRHRSRRVIDRWREEEGPDLWEDGGQGPSPPLAPGGPSETVH